jgi:pre-mRNA-processing factor 19
MFCAISGHAPEQPVASKKSGHVFERRLAEKYVAETGRCPVTGEPLSADDLLPLVPVAVPGGGNGNGAAAAAAAAPAPPRQPLAAASVPGLISLLRDEWDASALEAHSLRAQLHSARQELAHALYQHDAACRVIARLLRERDDARAALEAGGAPRGVGGEQQQQQHNGAANHNKRARPEGNDDGGGDDHHPTAALPDHVAEDVMAVSAELQKARRARAAPRGLPPAEAIGAFAPSAAHPLHATRPAGGVLCVAARGEVVATGGADGAVGLLDLASGRVLPGAPLKGGAGKGGPPVAAVAFCSDTCVLSCAPAERALRVWRAGDGGEWACALTLAVDDDEGRAAVAAAAAAAAGGKKGGSKAAAAAAAAARAVVGVAAHPSGRYALSATADGGWQTWDLSTGARLRAVAPPPPPADSADAPPASCAGLGLHPDGLIVATLQGAKVVLWELRSGACAASLAPPPPAEAEGGGGADAPPAPAAAATCLSFSENGYHLAVGAADGRVRVWDLRKSKLVRTLEAFSSSSSGGEGGGEGGSGGGGGGNAGAAFAVSGVAFDPSGSYLAVAGREGGVKVYSATKGADQWRALGSWPAQLVAKKAAHGVAWAAAAEGEGGGARALALLVAGSDHNVRVLEAPAAA